MRIVESLHKLKSKKRLAKALQAHLPYLENLAQRDDTYHSFSTVCGGKTRHIERPIPSLERIQKNIYELLNQGNKPAYLHSGVKGRSYITNAQAHVNSLPTVKIDIRKFYASTSSRKVYRYFADTLKCSPDVSGLLTKLTTRAGRLPIGTHTSQLLAFLVAHPMLEELATHAEENNIIFTCYVDDLTFSGTAATPAFLWSIKKIVHKHGYSYHQARCFQSRQKKIITGVLVHTQGIEVLPATKQKIRREVRLLQTSVEDVDVARLRSLVGHIAAASQIEKSIRKSLLALRKTGALAKLKS